MTVLSILIATVPEREKECSQLVAELRRQAEGLPVEVCVKNTPRGEPNIGTKRSQMYAEAKGAYAVCIDDDDWIPPEYVSTVLDALESNPDCVGHYELVEGHGPIPMLSIWTNAYPRWCEGPEAQRRFKVQYVRTPFHKTPLLREHALAVGFKDMGFGEDHEFSKRLKASGLLKTEVFIPRVLYLYRYGSNTTMFKGK